MSLWVHLLRVSHALCWLLALTYSQPAVATLEGGINVQAAHTPVDIETSAPKNITKVPASLADVLNAAAERSNSDSITLSPHPLPPDILEAIFPALTSKPVYADSSSYTSDESIEVLSPHQLSPEELEAIFPGATEDKTEHRQSGLPTGSVEALSPHQLSPEELEAIFPGATENKTKHRQSSLPTGSVEALSPHQLSPEELKAVFPNYQADSSQADEGKEDTDALPHHRALQESETASYKAVDLQTKDNQEALRCKEALSSYQQLSNELEAAIPQCTVVRSQFAGSETVFQTEILSAAYRSNSELKTTDSSMDEFDQHDYLTDDSLITGAIEIEITESDVTPDRFTPTVRLAGNPVETTGAIEIEIAESDTAIDASQDSESSPIAQRQSLPLETFSAGSTQFRFNGQPLNHLTKIDVETSYQLSNDITPVSLLRGSVSLANSLQRSVTEDQRLTVEHNGTYFQAEAITQSRTIAVEVTSPEIISGFGIQTSLTGACIENQTISEQRCSYTPALSTAEIDDILDLRQMGLLRIEGEPGEVVTPESLEAIAQPGFQRGANGEVIGLDLLFPNTGTRLSAASSPTVDRTEIRDIAPMFTLARRRQIVQMNDREAALGVTMRGNTWVAGDDNNLLSVLLQAVSALLPDARPNVEATHQPANTQVNKNLLLAANNARIPQQSLTLYHSGISRAVSPDEQATVEDIAPANFLGVWLGFSPVRTYKIDTQRTSQLLGSTRLIASAGAEGGGDDTNTRLQFSSSRNEILVASENLRDAYIQIYQDFYETDSQTTVTESYTEQTDYKPHVSFTGNKTTANSVLNYYAGAIAANNLNLYAGLDFTGASPQGWSYELGSIFYTQPDRDYYSQLSGRVSKLVPLASNAALSLSSGFNWALDRSNQIGDVEVNSRSSAVYLNANASIARFSFGARGTIGGILPNSTRDSLQLNAAVALRRNLSFSAFITPLASSSSYARYGASLSWQTPGSRGSLLKLNWTNNRYGYGRDAIGRDLSSNEDVFLFGVEL